MKAVRLILIITIAFLAFHPFKLISDSKTPSLNEQEILYNKEINKLNLINLEVKEKGFLRNTYFVVKYKYGSAINHRKEIERNILPLFKANGWYPLGNAIVNKDNIIYSYKCNNYRCSLYLWKDSIGFYYNYKTYDEQ